VSRKTLNGQFYSAPNKPEKSPNEALTTHQGYVG